VSADILLTHGYCLDEDRHEQVVMRPYPPLGILYLSSHLKARGFTVDVFDTTFSSFAALEQHLDRTRPAIVGVYCNLMTRRNALRVIAACRARGATVVVGGPEPAGYPEQYLANGADVVVFGEGELTLEELVPRLVREGTQNLGGIAGIAFAGVDGQVVRTPARAQIANLDDQPFPDRDAIDVDRYVEVWREHHGVGSVSLITSRGCQFRCNWCSHAVFGFTHRRRSPSNVADELELIRDRYRPDQVWYADDVFTLRHGWLFEYAAELDRRGLAMPFETISREDRLDERVVETLAAMGCRRLWVGAESGSQRILDAMERHTDAARVREMVHLLQRHGIEVGLFIMLGYEGEEEQDLQATVEHLKFAGADTFLTTVAYPIAGTGYHERVADRIIAPGPWEESSDRDLTVAGRRSKRYYQHATRWMVGEVAAHQERQQPRDQRDHRRLLRAYANARVGRIGMRLTRHEVEDG
jgi:anaerobic magnesium-protoporphyrin IX monomethyl ester cyclase